MTDTLPHLYQLINGEQVMSCLENEVDFLLELTKDFKITIEEGISPRFLRAYWDTLRHAIYKTSDRTKVLYDKSAFNRAVELMELATEITAAYWRFDNE